MSYRKQTYRRKFFRKSNSVKYGKTFKTKKGKVGRYKYIRGRRVAFVPKRRR